MSTMRHHISEADAEKIADRMIWRRLDTDSAYQNAEDAESQQAREDEIGQQVWADLESWYIID